MTFSIVGCLSVIEGGICKDCSPEFTALDGFAGLFYVEIVDLA